jgi:hypothetical protein
MISLDSPRHLMTRSMLTRLALVALAGLLGLGEAPAEDSVKFAATVSAKSVRVAEPFLLELTATVPVGTRVTFPSSGSRLGDFEVIESQDLFDIPDPVIPETRMWSRRLTLESLETGELGIPSIEIHVKDEEGVKVVRSDAIVVPVVSVLEDRGDPTRFRTIQSVVDVEVPVTRSSKWLWPMLGGGVFALCVLVGVGITRRRRRLTPKAWAFQELGELETSIGTNLPTSEAFAVALSKTVREYLMMQLAIPEAGLTSQELVQDVESGKQIDEDVTSELRELFKLADKAKFAGLQLSPESFGRAINDCRKIVDRIAEGSKMNPQTLDAAESQ